MIAKKFPSRSAGCQRAARSGLTNIAAKIGRLAADLFFDAVECADAVDGFGGDRRRMNRVDVVELTAGMCPACDFVYGTAFVEVMEACIGIRLQRTLEVLQMCSWMLALAIRRICEPRGRSSRCARGTFIAHIGPQSSRFRLSVSRRKRGHWRVVGMNLLRGQNVVA